MAKTFDSTSAKNAQAKQSLVSRLEKKKPAAPAKPVRKKAAKKPDVGGQIDRLQKRSRDLEDWQEEVEDALAQGLNILVGGKREAAEKASEDAAEFEREQQHNAIEAGQT